MSEAYIENFNENCLLPLSDNYYDARIEGDFSFIDDIGKRPIILVGNHAGACLSWDNIIFDALFWRQTKVLTGTAVKITRLVHPSLYNGHVSPFLIKGWWKKMKCEPCTIKVFDRLCSENKVLYMSPEGIQGLAKGYRRKNEVLPFSTSFMMMAKKYNALVVPVSITNSEYLNPLSWSPELTSKVAKRLFGLPFFPIAPCTLTLLIPKYFIASLPAKMRYRVIKPLEPAILRPNEYTHNQVDAEAVRALIQNDIKEREQPMGRGLRLKLFFKHMFFGKDERSVSKHYQIFWEEHLGRGLNVFERLLFHIPILGYFLVSKFMNKEV